MAHNIYTRNNRASMMYVGKTPWHTLGVKLDKPATSTEAIVAAGMDFRVEKQKLFVRVPGEADIQGPNFNNQEVPKHFATMRMDTHEVLGVVGARYEPIQNKDAFSFFDAIVGEGSAIYETAGVLGKGERIWILAKMPDYIKVKGDDIINKYLLLMNSHDGSSLVRAKVTPIRVVCENTLSMALKGAGQEVRIRHTASGQASLDAAHKVLGLTNTIYDQLSDIFNQMARKTFLSSDLKQYVNTLVPDNTTADDNWRTEAIREKVLELHETGRGAEMAYGTAWGAYNAITEFTDHVQGSRNPKKALQSMWFGGGEVLKQKAFILAMKMCN